MSDSKCNTPFWQGQAAFKAGQPVTANPHDPDKKTNDPEDWPWDHANWRDGWVHAQAAAAFTASKE
ncbi:hypothetical protein [Yoonia sp.]|uniref:hypothetical protein n=1 Tax=Yoonia sp. TaxID=2212373 RepID=UPI002E07BA85|nr:hypothetical protein [Yoonia sp.]